jgi:hypothetical protein
MEAKKKEKKTLQITGEEGKVELSERNERLE